MKMNRNTFNQQIFDEIPIVGIMRNIAHDDVMRLLPIYIEAGLTTVEITMNSVGATRTIGQVVQEYGNILNIGAGTVCNLHDLELSLAAGAQFIVSPNVDEEVIKTCKSQHVPVFPGAFTPTEIYKAWRLGADMVKVFPAKTLGAGYCRDLQGPMAQIPLMATGGIGLSDIPVYRAVGVQAFGIGSPLFAPNFLAAGDWKGLKSRFEKFVETIKRKPSKHDIHGQI